jgi:uncharacterized membrane protein YdjX (TVP38/TMEM64 family)
MRHRRRVPIGLLRVLPVAVIACAAIAGFVLLRDTLTLEALERNRFELLAFRDRNYLFCVAVFMLVYVSITGLGLPGATLSTLTGGFLFGIFPGVFFNVISATTGATIVFMAVRAGFGRRLAARLDQTEGAVKKVKAGIDANQWETLFLIRLMPVIPFFVANLLAGLLAVPLRRFFIATLFGIMPGALVYTSVGAGLGEVLDLGERPDLGVIFQPRFLLPILGLCALALVPVVVKARARRKAAG